MAGLKAATYLGLAGKEVEPDEVEVFETKPLFEQAEELKHLPKSCLCSNVYNLKDYYMIHMFTV